MYNYYAALFQMLMSAAQLIMVASKNVTILLVPTIASAIKAMVFLQGRIATVSCL